MLMIINSLFSIDGEYLELNAALLLENCIFQSAVEALFPMRTIRFGIVLLWKTIATL